MEKTVFTYVNIVGKGCEGWLNLFFGEHCVAMIHNVELADNIRKEISTLRENVISKIHNDCHDGEGSEAANET